MTAGRLLYLVKKFILVAKSLIIIGFFVLKILLDSFFRFFK